MIAWRVPLFEARFDADDEDAVLRPLRTGWLTMGEEVLRLEEELCAATGAKYAIAVSNCSVAIHLACAALGIGAGDEVLCPTLTFVASANAPKSLGARIRLCESVDVDDLTVDPASLEANLSPLTKAMIVVHYAGFPCRMQEIIELAHARGIAIIEDCAHALFSRSNGQTLGLLGRIGCFSFFSNKNVTCGEGGALITNDSALANECRLLRSHGMTTMTLDRHNGRAFSYDVLCPGFNYRMDEMRAALLRSQLRKLPGFLERRRKVYGHYVRSLEGTSVHMPFRGPRFRADFENLAIHILPVLLPNNVDRNAIMASMKEAGIQTSIHYPPVHTFTAYREQAHDLSRTEALSKRELTLPFYPHMDEECVHFVVKTLLKSISRVQVST